MNKKFQLLLTTTLTITGGVYLQRSAYGKLYYFNYYYLVDSSDEKEFMCRF